ncbi:cAMP-dependent protein kinase regulatory subunit [Histomonas meleagridis]|uniref:cAMP-dependent protein kinase regulatory subunit n=1 Tax=Histomonas meleagridis TaxID=135588 RepID=UPI00355AB8D0|nr:cAMP-dependent protein kinase regulatory subunit [Histomonas meleagridis]KAH0800874.1 cAMP-dependent protein kinase regulatory subunit [Histomonas meleagridis]
MNGRQSPEQYIESKKIKELLKKIVVSLLEEQPENPESFIVSLLSKNQQTTQKSHTDTKAEPISKSKPISEHEPQKSKEQKRPSTSSTTSETIPKSSTKEQVHKPKPKEIAPKHSTKDTKPKHLSPPPSIEPMPKHNPPPATEPMPKHQPFPSAKESMPKYGAPPPATETIPKYNPPPSAAEAMSKHQPFPSAKETMPKYGAPPPASETMPKYNAPHPATEAMPKYNPPPSAAETMPKYNPPPPATETMPKYQPFPSAKETMPKYNPPPSAAETMPKYNPPPSAAETMPKYNPPPPATEAMPKYQPFPSVAETMPKYNPPPSAAETMPKYNPPPSAAETMPKYNPPPSAAETMPKYNPPPSAAETMPKYNPPPSAAETMPKYSASHQFHPPSSDDNSSIEEWPTFSGRSAAFPSIMNSVPTARTTGRRQSAINPAILARNGSAYRRKAMSSRMTSNDVVDIKVVPKDPETLKSLQESVRKVDLFSFLQDDQLETLVNAMFPLDFEDKHVIIRQGDLPDNFYILRSGKVRVLKKTGDREVQVAVLNPGQYFGELALISGSTRAATIIADGPCQCWAIDQTTYLYLLKEQHNKKRQRYKSLLRNVPFLKVLQDYEILLVADALQPVNPKPNEVIMKQGDNGDEFYIILEGECAVLKRDDKGVNHEVCHLKSGSYFGELALMQNTPRAATIVALENCKLVKLDRASFHRLLGPCSEIFKENMKNY